ncbi:hypothetical protein [Nonlabens sp. SY33080]|uniref:hypothetical protein n=1 Tax=Nonlabens sp. SY33080 TaxID=2719911 RepID=UPI001428CC9A|nr:hypothetical protein [Nonlabens sp. SY33080]
MRLLKFLFVVSLLWNCYSCYSYRVLPTHYEEYGKEITTIDAFVIGDSLKQELKIIKASGLFNVMSDSTEANVVLKLYPLKRTPVCGQPLTLSMITLGQVPVYMPDYYQFKFDEIRNNEVTEKEFTLQITQRVWFWDMFVFNKKFDEKAGLLLKKEYYQNQ